jgi:hypothetical protein
MIEIGVFHELLGCYFFELPLILGRYFLKSRIFIVKTRRSCIFNRKRYNLSLILIYFNRITVIRG